MSLPLLLTNLVEYVAAEIASCLELEDPSEMRVLRYHGTRTVPPNCCTEIGSLVGSWDFVERNTSLGQRGRTDATKPGWPGIEIVLRYMTCWPAPTPTDSGPVLVDDEWDATSEKLATVAECGARALICVQTSGSPEALAVLAETGCSSLAFERAEPIDPSVNCAGVLWRSYASLVGGTTL